MSEEFDYKAKIRQLAEDGLKMDDIPTASELIDYLDLFILLEGGQLPGPTPAEPPPEPKPPYLLDLENLPPNNIIVEVVEDPATPEQEKVPLREWYRTNDNGFPIWGIFGKKDIPERIVAKGGKKLVVWSERKKGDGGNYAYELANGQIVDGVYIYTDNTGTYTDVNMNTFSSPNRTRLYILERHVKV